MPAATGTTIADLAVALELPLIVVARAALGTINHTLLTPEAASARRLTVAGVVISHSGGKLSAADSANLGQLHRDLGDTLIGEIPPLAADDLPLDGMIDVEGLINRLAPGSR